MKTISLVTLSLSLCLAATACSSDDDEVTPEADACEHMADGPSEAVTAAAASTDDGPDVGEHHTRFDITLVASGTDYVGFVDVVAEEAGEMLIFSDGDTAMKLWNGTTEIAAEATNANVTECSEVTMSRTFDVEVTTYTLELGPTDQTSISLVFGEAGGHDHDHQ